MTKVITLESNITRTPRVMQLEGMFDIESEKNSITEIPFNGPDLNAQSWNVGLLVGASGAGKSTVAKHLFGDVLQKSELLKWSHDKALIDDFPKTMSIREITDLLSSVGFSSPPAWLRSFYALSNGEQFRVNMARIISENNDLTVVDEFTSVIDRTTAQIGSHAIAKTIRKRDQKFVAITCHYDIEEWLQPDWIYQPSTGEFTWGSVQPRPQVNLQIFHAKYSAWQVFARHHYLDSNLNPAAQLYVATVNDRPAALIAVLQFPHPKIKNAKRISRIVVMPDFQGVGIGIKFLNVLTAGYKANGFVMYVTTSHSSFMKSLNKSDQWKLIRSPSRVSKADKSSNMNNVSRSRLTTSFMYAGTVDFNVAKTLELSTTKP